jgi:uncharacterized membrane protein YhiD involved in acid resistance
MLPLDQVLLRLTVAALLGAAIGIERDLRKRPAGIRTSLFVSLGAALFTLLSGVIPNVLATQAARESLPILFRESDFSVPVRSCAKAEA